MPPCVYKEISRYASTPRCASQPKSISFKLRHSGFQSSSHSVVRLSILPSQGSDSGSNPDGSITLWFKSMRLAYARVSDQVISAPVRLDQNLQHDKIIERACINARWSSESNVKLVKKFGMILVSESADARRSNYDWKWLIFCVKTGKTGQSSRTLEIWRIDRCCEPLFVLVATLRFLSHYFVKILEKTEWNKQRRHQTTSYDFNKKFSRQEQETNTNQTTKRF